MRPLLLLPLFLLAACGRDPVPEPAAPGALLRSQTVATVTRGQVLAYTDGFSVEDYAVHDVLVRRLTYRTELLGEPVDVRALLLTPAGVDSAVLAAYCHGTHIPLGLLGVEQQSPSNYDGSGSDFLETRSIGLPLASAGYAVLLTDYVGYTISDHLEHPYVHWPALFPSILHGLLAARELLAAEGPAVDDRVFLAGWSQGAGAALATHRFLERDHADAFTVAGTSGLAGPYHFSGFLNEVFERQDERWDLLGLYSWALYSVNAFSDLRRPTDQLWDYPVPDQLAAATPPSLVPEEVFNAYFLERLIDGRDTAMAARIRGNDHHAGWRPLAPVFLHHGMADDIVPFFNSAHALEGLSAEGGDVTLYAYPDGDHLSELDRFVLGTLADFNALR
jgi:hypothetical protein